MVGLLLLIGLVSGIGYAVFSAVHNRFPAASGGPWPSGERPAPSRELADRLAEWVAAGLISTEESAGIARYERAGRRRPEVARQPGDAAQRLPVVAEALGYLGGALGVGGLVQLVGRNWPDLPTAGRLGLSGAAAALLAAGGLLLHDSTRPMLLRLRTVLWLASCTAGAVWAVTAVHDGFGVDRGASAVLAGASAVALESGLLWRWRQGPAMQLAFLAASTTAVGAAVGHLDDPQGWIGLTVMALGAAAVISGLRRWVSAPVLTEGFGSFAVLVGGDVTAGHWQAVGLLLVTAAGAVLVSLALVPGWAPGPLDQIAIGVIGAVALVQAVPGTLGYFSSQAGAVTGLTTYALGVAIAYTGARRQVRLALVVEAVGGATMLIGAAATFPQWHGFAPILGALTAVALIGLGMLPRHLVLSLLGSAGLLVNVPWGIGWFFPGRGRVPGLIAVCGVLIVVVAALLGYFADRASDSAAHVRSGAPGRPPDSQPSDGQPSDGQPPDRSATRQSAT